MALRDRVVRVSMWLLQEPRVMQKLRDERTTRTLIGALRADNRVRNAVDGAVASVARRFGLATRDDVRELERAIIRLEQERDRLRAERRG
jgi:hypothetical protein